MHLNAKTLIESLKLDPHQEGGYFRRTYEADHRDLINVDGAQRFLMTSIYYMLTSDTPLGCFHRNQSDIMHVHNCGAALRYFLLSPEGDLQTIVLGPHIEKNQSMQFVVRGGYWKATELLQEDEYDFGLLTEVVVPGFDYADMTLGESDEMIKTFPQHKDLISRFAFQAGKSSP